MLRGRIRRGGARTQPLTLGCFALALAACDPTSGLQDTADAALPDVKRYFDGAGQNIAPGPWNRVVVDLDADTLYHVGARRLDDEQPTFHLFGVDARDGCSVSPNAGTWLMGKADAAPYRLLPYLEEMDERGRGTLRFTTVDCEVQEIAVPDAGRPYPRLYDDGYLVPTKAGYTFVDPWRGETREIAAELQGVLVWASTVLLWADGKLKSFTEQFEARAELGEGIVGVTPVYDDFLIEDASGVHLARFDRSTLELSSEELLEDGCKLSPFPLPTEKGNWVALEQPCGSGQAVLLHLERRTGEELERMDLPLELDTRYLRVIILNEQGEFGIPTTLFYLTDVDEDGLGTLWAWQRGVDEPVRVGERADLEGAFLEGSLSAWEGVAQVNYQDVGGYWAHDRLHFNWDGTSEVVAERIIRNQSDGSWLINFDGKAGDLPLFVDDTVVVVAEGVPAELGEATSFIGERMQARIEHFDGNSGQARISSAQVLGGPWTDLGSAVTPESLRFAWFMPAAVFIDAWDPETGTGDLVSYNYELDARVTIAQGVSSYDLTSYPWHGVIYAVPYGKKRGVWFSKAK